MNGALLAAIGLSVLSAVAYALAAVVQERLASRPGSNSLVGSVRGWSAICLNGGGALLHVVALAYGSLTVVQPLGALTLVVALPAGAAIAGRRVRGREWRGAAATVAGLVGVLVAADTGAPSRALSDVQTLVLLAVIGTLILALARPQTGHFPGIRLAVAGGAAFAVASILTQTVLLRISEHGVDALLDPALGVAVVAVGTLSVGGLLLSQAAYKHGLGAPLATLTIVNPVVAAAVGIGLLGQGTGLSVPDIGAALLFAAVAAAGVVQLATPGGARETRSKATSRRTRSRRRRRSAAVRCAQAAPGRHLRHPEKPGEPADADPASARGGPLGVS
jgi:drug/metabolite transporter (DMT)-like permease